MCSKWGMIWEFDRSCVQNEKDCDNSVGIVYKWGRIW